MRDPQSTPTLQGCEPLVSSQRFPWWGRVLTIYAVSRLWGIVIMVTVSRGQAANLFSSARPSLLTYVGAYWDSWWYQGIAANGYPRYLPAAHGHVAQNPWAFFPLYPAIVRTVMAPTRLPWNIAAPAVSLVAGGAAMLIIYRLVQVVTPKSREIGFGAVAFISFFASSLVLSAAYTESISLLGVALFMYMLVRRRYGWVAVILFFLAFARAIALPLAVVIAVHAIYRWYTARHAAEKVKSRTWFLLAGLTIEAVIAGFAWTWITGAITGIPDAYLKTQLAWRASGTTQPLVPWFRFLSQIPPYEAVAVIAVFTVLLVAMFSRSARSLGIEMQTLGISYTIYLLGVTEPNTSMWRFMLLNIPAFATLATFTHDRPWLRRLITTVLALSQIVWVWELWRVHPGTGIRHAP